MGQNLVEEGLPGHHRPEWCRHRYLRLRRLRRANPSNRHHAKHDAVRGRPVRPRRGGWFSVSSWPQSFRSQCGEKSLPMVRVASGDLVYNVPAKMLVDETKAKLIFAILKSRLA